MRREIPILMCAENIPLLLNGSKTVTRRIIKPQPWYNGEDRLGEIWRWGPMSLAYPSEWVQGCRCHVGDHLWMKEPLFTPKRATRIWREVVDVRAERLQTVTGEDALLEGLTSDALQAMMKPIAMRAKTEPLHWVHGADEGMSYCYKCAVKRVRELKKKNPKADIYVDGGWGGESEDGIEHCDTCGVILEASLNCEGVEEEMEYHEEYGIYPSPGGVYHFFDMLNSGDLPDEPDFAGRIARIGYRWMWDRLNAKPKKVKRNPYTLEREDCYVSYPWEDVRKVESRRGLNHYIVGNCYAWRISFKETHNVVAKR